MNAEVAEQADAHDSKSCSLGSVGSIPTFGMQRAAQTPWAVFLLKRRHMRSDIGV
jgi:hypothetical protein